MEALDYILHWNHTKIVNNFFLYSLAVCERKLLNMFDGQLLIWSSLKFLKCLVKWKIKIELWKKDVMFNRIKLMRLFIQMQHRCQTSAHAGICICKQSDQLLFTTNIHDTFTCLPLPPRVLLSNSVVSVSLELCTDLVLYYICAFYINHSTHTTREVSIFSIIGCPIRCPRVLFLATALQMMASSSARSTSIFDILLLCT